MILNAVSLGHLSESLLLLNSLIQQYYDVQLSFVGALIEKELLAESILFHKTLQHEDLI
jgi:hypothetical protein